MEKKVLDGSLLVVGALRWRSRIAFENAVRIAEVVDVTADGGMCHFIGTERKSQNPVS